MFIHGLQKMTLLDFPGRVACTVFLGGCDFRCPFCHNSDLLDMNAKPLMDDEELLAFLRTRRGLLDGVAFTGGEPLLRPDIADLFRRVRALGYSVKLDTNGRVPYEFRTTVVREFHDGDSFRGIAEMIRGAERYFLQCFTDRDSVLLGGLHAPSREEMERFADIVRPYVGSVQIRGMD